MKVASFHVRATEAQSIRWNRAAEADGHRPVGSWLAEAADVYLKARARAGRPIPLAWHKGRFRAPMEGGETEVRGLISKPFAYFRGTLAGISPNKSFALIYLPELRLIATLKSARQCRALASEMAPVLIRGDPGGIVERHEREAK